MLSETHAVGKSKAKFFLLLGFGEENVEELELALLKIVQTNEVEETSKNQHGKKYVIDGALENPKGVIIHVRTVWIIETGDNRPRFVTAYPLE